MAFVCQTPEDVLQHTDTPLEKLPLANLSRSFDMDYIRIQLPDGGDLYVTHYGWRNAEKLMPQCWFTDKYFSRFGTRLPGSTGTVYRVPTKPVNGKSIDIVVKFSRVGQEVPLVVATFPDGVLPEDVTNARFNSPFEEFGLLHEMRHSRYGPRNLRILAHLPLAIYTPPKTYDIWQLGRSRTRFFLHQRMLKEDQENIDEPLAIELDIKRDYVLLYSWIKGLNAEEHFLNGELDKNEFEGLSTRINKELADKGYRVLDNKPKHFILRKSKKSGKFIRRNGKLSYALIDFELLERTETVQQEFTASRRAKYWAIQSKHSPPSAYTYPPQLAPVNIMGVDYVYGTAPNGAKIWATGTDPELFDYFLPDRWRRTPRIKLSSINEVYRSCTRDNIHVVYRRSRVGEKPHVDPFYDYGKHILRCGFNSPFEEISIAESLRRQGIQTIHPRAIYRTGSKSETASYLADNSRYDSHISLLLPDDNHDPILSPLHDYYVIWGLWRGIDPTLNVSDKFHGIIDIQQAYEEKLLKHNEYQTLLKQTRYRMNAIGFTDQIIQHTRFLLTPDVSGNHTFLREANGEFKLTFGLDVLRAYDHNLITESQYHHIVEHQRERLNNAGFELLELHGDHILLSVNPDGVIKTNDNGEMELTHCNFDLIRRHNKNNAILPDALKI